MSRMFPFITRTWNPLGGKCQHECSYCWARKLAEQKKMMKYQGCNRIYPKELQKQFKPSDFIFVCDMCDLFGDWVFKPNVQAILDVISGSPARFLLLTKNPKRYREFEIPLNCVCGATIECDMNFKVSGNAPTPYSRIMDLRDLRIVNPKMVSIEPIMNFTENFPYMIAFFKPEFVAVGYDNYHNGLPEPSMSKTMMLIDVLESFGVKVYRKTLREVSS